MSTTVAPSPPVARPPTTTDLLRRGGTDGLDPGQPEAGARWVTPAVVALLAFTALAYLWNLSASGWGNSFYAAAVQAGTKSWKAFFFGSIDASNFITVDKSPGSLWVMELSGRIFGFNSWSLLAPQALEGVAAVGIVYATVKRWFGPAAGLLSGAVLAATPAAALMFRFDNPDALLVLLLVASAYTLVRGLEKGGTRWIVATGALLGFAFLAKMLQAFTVLPAFFVVYLIAAPVSLRRRLGQLAIGGAVIVAAAGWWVATVALWPTGSRPLIDGSADNSIINLIFGYNGFGRLYSSSSSGGGQGGNFSGATGPLRLFDTLMGGQASWLIPAALLVVVAGVAWRGRAPRTDRTRAALLLWGGWLIVTGAVFSFGQGVIHTYYTVALAPAIAALIGIGATLVWRGRRALPTRLLGAAGIVGSAVWATALLQRTPSYHPWLRPVVLLSGVIGAVALVAAPLAGRLGRRVVLGALALGLVACLSGPVAFAATTVTTVHTGSLPSAGPASSAAGSFGRGASGTPAASGPTASGAAASGAAHPTSAGGRPSGTRPTGTTAPGDVTGHAASSGGGSGTISAALTSALNSHASSYRWAAATLGSQSAASLELASGQSVMAIGGFNGEGGNITLATFESYVAKGDIHYFIASGGGAGGQGNATSDTSIVKWVQSHYRATTIGGETVYDLTAADG